MPDTYITEKEVFTLGTSFRNLIEKVKKLCRDRERSNTAKETAALDADDDVIALRVTIDGLEKRLDRAASLTTTDAP